MTLAAECGAEMELEVDGSDEKERLAAIEQLIKDKFGMKMNKYEALTASEGSAVGPIHIIQSHSLDLELVKISQVNRFMKRLFDT